MRREEVGVTHEASSTRSEVTGAYSAIVISEVQEVADRVGIIREGMLVAVENVERLKERALRRTVIPFARPIDPALFAALEGVKHLEVRDRTLVLVVAGSMDRLVKLAARYEVEAFTSEEADLSA